MWLIAFGSAIHRRSSCAEYRSSQSSVRERDTGMRLIKVETYAKGAIPTNDAPKILEESLLRSSSLFGHDIPMVS